MRDTRRNNNYCLVMIPHVKFIFKVRKEIYFAESRSNLSHPAAIQFFIVVLSNLMFGHGGRSNRQKVLKDNFGSFVYFVMIHEVSIERGMLG